MRNENDNHLAAYRFVILKAVIRKDLIQTLPLPRRLLDYLNYKHCYSEQVESDSSHSQVSPLTHLYHLYPTDTVLSLDIWRRFHVKLGRATDGDNDDNRIRWR